MFSGTGIDQCINFPSKERGSKAQSLGFWMEQSNHGISNWSLLGGRQPIDSISHWPIWVDQRQS